MKTKILSFGAAVPILALGVMGNAGSAKAAFIGFSNGDTFNFNYSIQINANIAGNPDTGEFPGLGPTDPEVDVLFAPTVSTPPDFTVDAGNRVLDAGNGGSPGGIDAAPGEQATIAAAGGNTGAFANIQPPLTTLGRIRNFDFNFNDLGSSNLSEVNGLISGTEFIDITDNDPMGQVQFLFALEEITDVDFNSPQTGDFLFSARGQVQAIDTNTNTILQTVSGVYRTTGQFAFDDGSAGDPVAGDGITSVTSNSGSFTVTDIPEPMSVLSTLFIAGFGLLTTGRKFKRS